MIEFSILGSTKLRTKDSSFDHSFLTGPKRLALLTYLILAKPRLGFHRRDKLIALFWPERGQKSARNALNNMLYQIRSTLGKEILKSRGNEEISINREEIWCDAVAFEEALDNGTPKKALELYRANLLLGFHVTDISNEFQDWLDEERQRLRLRAAEGAWTLAEKSEEVGNDSEARTWAKKAAALTPFDDDAHARLITVLKRLGYRSEALEVYEDFEQRIHEEWDMEPTAELKSLVANMDVPAEESKMPSAPPGLKKETQTESSENKDHIEASAKTESSKRLPFPYKWIGGIALLIFLAVIGWLIVSDTSSEINRPPLISEQSVAVLPFTYLSAEDSTDYFSLGMTEEILTRLAQIEDLSVISRTSVMQYQNSDKSIREIGEELGVAAIVEGSVQQEGNQVRITAQLIDARTDHHLWSESYNRPMRNILSLQSEVAANIAESLQAELLPQERQQLSTYRDVDETAYHLYLRGQHLMSLREPEGIVEAPAVFQEAISHDSTFAPAYGGLAMASIWSGLINRFDHQVVEVHGLPREEAFAKAMQAANQALALDSTNVQAHLAQALVYELNLRDWARSGEAFQKALSLNPNHSEARREYGWHLLRLGQIEDALEQMQRAVEVDPLSWSAHHGLGYALYCNLQYEDAIQQLTTALNLGSRYPNTKKYISTARFKRSQQLFQQGQDAEAEALIENATSLLEEMWGSNNGWREPLQLAIEGRETETIESLDRVELPFAPRLYMLLLIGHKEAALDLIKQGIFFEMRVFADPIFDPVRDEPRFEQMAEDKLQRNLDI